MMWVYVTTHNGAGNGACVVSIDDQTDDVDEFYLNASTSTNLTLGIVTLQGGSAAGDVGTATFQAGSWQHVCIVRSANNLRTGYRNGVSEVTHTLNRSGRTAPTAISIGSVLDSDLLNGRVACIKIWTEALTVAEIQQEIGVIHPVRTANLNRWTPGFTHTDIADYSGNGYGWTAVGTLATEDGPPVSWGAAPWVVPWAATAAAHDLTATGITTGAPTLDTPTIAQIHALTAAAITTAAPTVATATIGQVHALAASGIATGAPVLDTPSMAGTAALTASGITTAAPTLGTPALGQVHALSASGITTGAPALGTPIALPHLAATIGGVLTADGTNGRYFANNAGPLVLAGFHTWYDLQDGGTSNPPTAFGWSTYKSALTSYGVNFTKLWRLESTRHWPSDNTQYFGIQPWARTGPGNAADGALKFDLTQFNQDYFDRLRVRCIELGNAGVYVVIQLFQGFHVDDKPDGGVGAPWTYHPMAAANNVNSIDGDTDNDGYLEETRATTFTAVYNIQKAFVEKVIDTVNDLDNVLYEIENEGGTYAETWQKALIDYIHTYESGKAKQHPVGMTKIYPSGTNSMLTGSNAEWISPDEDLTPAIQNSTSQVWMYDTDHAVGITDTRAWAWIALTQGYGGAWYMDLWDSGAGGAGDTISDATYQQIRRTLGWVLDYAARIDLQHATPNASISSTGYALAKTTGAAQILAYQSASGAFTVNLTGISGTFSLEWQRVANSAGTIQAGSNVTGGATRTLTPPWSGEDVIAFLQLTQNDLTASGITTGAPTLGAVTIAQIHALSASGFATGAAALDTPAVGQTHVLSAAGVTTGMPALDAPAVAQAHALAAAGITAGTPTLDAPTIAQVHVLTAAAITTGAATLGTPSMSGESALSADDITTSAPTLGMPAIAQIHVLTAVTVVTGAAVVDTPAIAQTHVLSADGITTGTPALGTPSMTGEATLAADGITTGAPALDTPIIGQVHVLTAGGVTTGAPDTGAPSINQIHVLTAVLIVAGSPTLGMPSLDSVVPPTPAERTFVVAWEDRTFVVSAEDRTFVID